MIVNYIVACVLGIFASICVLSIVGSVAVTLTALRGKEVEYPKYSPIMGVSCLAIVAVACFLLWILQAEINKLI